MAECETKLPDICNRLQFFIQPIAIFVKMSTFIWKSNQSGTGFSHLAF